MSLQDASAKVRELRWFKNAQTLCSTFPMGEPEQPDAPAADIRFSYLNLGIEITEYLTKQQGGSSRRGLESERDKIIAEAQRIFENGHRGSGFCLRFLDARPKADGESARRLAQRDRQRSPCLNRSRTILMGNLLATGLDEIQPWGAWRVCRRNLDKSCEGPQRLGLRRRRSRRGRRSKSSSSDQWQRIPHSSVSQELPKCMATHRGPILDQLVLQSR